jgi:hypothetical protein
MRRSAGFMTRNGTLPSRAMNRAARLVAPANGPYINKIRRGRQNANRAENRTVREH